MNYLLNFVYIVFQILFRAFLLLYCIRYRMESVHYIIETEDDCVLRYNAAQMRESMDDLPQNIKTICKKYRLSYKKGKIFKMTLFTDERQDISADEFIEYYKGIPRDVYGSNVLSDLDKEIIEMLN